MKISGSVVLDAAFNPRDFWIPGPLPFPAIDDPRGTKMHFLKSICGNVIPFDPFRFHISGTYFKGLSFKKKNAGKFFMHIRI